MKNNSKPKIFIILIAVFILLFLVYNWSQNDSAQASPLEPFARCLANSGTIMYGADWCPHCQNQKGMFGKSFKFINYVECPQDPKRCLADGIDAYPTWLMPNGEKLVGEQKFETLSQKTNCALPIEASPL